MKMSSRIRYGIRSIVELALRYGESPVQTYDIAERVKISAKYIEQVVSILKRAGLVRSVRGRHGGYMLAKSPEEITLQDVFVALEGPERVEKCPEHSKYSPRCADCITCQVWQEMQNAILGVVGSVTLADLFKSSLK